jgi:HemY protein
MRAFLKFALPAILILVLAWWIGDVVAQSGPYTIQISAPAAILLLVLIAGLLTVTFRFIGALRRSPGQVFEWRRAQRQKQGELALHRGIAALAVGDGKQAETAAIRAQKFLGETPLVLLLLAESARLAGDHDTAIQNFERLSADKHLGFAGHHGLLRHSLAIEDHETAANQAGTALQKFPGANWVQQQRLHLAVAQKHFAQALTLTREPHEIAALATAAAATATPREATTLAERALRAVPGFAPAAVAYAKALRARNKARAAASALLASWKVAPHPLIAAAYLETYPTPIARAQAAGDLAAAAPQNPESSLILAETALAATLPAEARRHANAAIAAGLTDSRPLAVLAVLDSISPPPGPVPAWACTNCATKVLEWSPTCPHCKKLGRLTWKTPVTPLPS